ncbi:hypothetical protein CAC42_1251 [Sphaceloma murrayae]|uniref:Uncharacterized protein n=1 Tax=Sphaceloma murrayae TaxID=2082308 RepID=A0A2K1R2F9_9PEZI|nr:hypothetical protein CAC42_1251 [Sphaceloma murrayae]
MGPMGDALRGRRPEASDTRPAHVPQHRMDSFAPPSLFPSPGYHNKYTGFRPTEEDGSAIQRKSSLSAWASPSHTESEYFAGLPLDLSTLSGSSSAAQTPSGLTIGALRDGDAMRFEDGQTSALGLKLPPLTSLQNSRSARSPMGPRCKTCTSIAVMVQDLVATVTELGGEIESEKSPISTYSCQNMRDVPPDPAGAMQSLDHVIQRLRSLRTDVQRLKTYQPRPGIIPDADSAATQNIRTGGGRAFDWYGHGHNDSEQDRTRKRLRSLSPRDRAHCLTSVISSAPSPSLSASQTRMHSTRASITEADHNRRLEPTPKIHNAFTSPSSPSSTFGPPRILPSPSSLAQQDDYLKGPGKSVSQIPALNPSEPTTLTALHSDLRQRTLALQNLQSAHDLMVQKFNRERTRTATMEKKAAAAEKEVNNLTTTNEDLHEQIKNLETQMDDLETKVGREREDAGKERRQWREMMENQTRLMERYMVEKRGWEEARGEWEVERRGLQMVVEGRGREVEVLKGVVGGSEGRAVAGGQGMVEDEKDEKQQENEARKVGACDGHYWGGSTGNARLRGQIEELEDQVALLRGSLSAVKGENLAVREQAQRILDAVSRNEERTEAALSSTVS